MQSAGYMNKKTITPGWYWVRVKDAKADTIAQVTGEAPGLEVRTIPDAWPSFSEVEFICRVPTPEQVVESERSKLACGSCV